MTTYSMQELGPEHPLHSKVPWPAHLESTVCVMPHSFIPLLQSNIPPSSNEAFRIREFLAASLQLEKQIFACDVILSPFRHLPDDILYRITTHCPLFVLQQTVSTRPRSQSPIHFPSTLTQVCRGWRDVVLGISSLWSEVRIESVQWDSRAFEILQTRCTSFARLSGTLPLSVDLGQIPPQGCQPQGWGVNFEGTQDRYLAALEWVWKVWHNDRCSNITKLTLRVDWDKDFLHQILYLIRSEHTAAHPLPNALALKSLRVIGIRSDRCENYMEDRSPLGLFIVQSLDMFPNLRHFSLEAIALANLSIRILGDDETCPNRPWTSLKTINLTPSLTITDLWALLTACPNLEVAALTIHVLEEEDTMTSNICVHHALAELELTILLVTETLEEFSFKSLQFPNLYRLNVEWGISYPALGMAYAEPVHTTTFINAFPAIRILEIRHICQWDLQRTLELYHPIFIATPTTLSVRVSLSGIVQLRTALDFFNDRFSSARVGFLPGLEDLIMEVTPCSSFNVMAEDQIEEVVLSVLDGLRCRLREGRNLENSSGDKEDERLGPLGGEVSSWEMVQDEANARTRAVRYHRTTVRYIWGNEAQFDAEGSLEWTCFLDLARQFPGGEDKGDVVVEVVKMQAREKCDIVCEKEIFNRFEV